MIVYGVAKFHFRFYLVAFGYGHKTHVVAKAYKAGSLPVVPAGSGAGPGAQLLQHFLVLPVAYNYFPGQAKAAHHKPKLAVAMGALVQVHEIHIDLAPGNIAVKLRV